MAPKSRQTNRQFAIAYKQFAAKFCENLNFKRQLTLDNWILVRRLFPTIGRNPGYQWDSAQTSANTNWPSRPDDHKQPIHNIVQRAQCNQTSETKHRRHHYTASNVVDSWSLTKHDFSVAKDRTNYSLIYSNITIVLPASCLKLTKRTKKKPLLKIKGNYFWN